PAAADMPVEHHLLRFPAFAAAQIDAFAEAHHRALRAEPKARAARQAQQHGAALLRQRRLHQRMEMEADGKSLARAPGEAVLAAQILAIGGEKELARMGKPEGRLVAVMARLEPLRAFILGAL